MRWIHILAGVVALLSGAAAMYAAKGGTLHRRSGLIFAIAMIVLTSSAVAIAGFLRPNPVNFVAGSLTFYLVCTGLLTVRRTVDQSRPMLTGFMALAFAGSVYAFLLAFEAMSSPGGTIDGIPPQPLFMFGTIGLIGSVSDARLLRARSIEGARRLGRHLWRMTFAMWIATASFFLGQAQFIPKPIRRIELLVIPVVVVLVFLVYWMARVRMKRRRASELPMRSDAVASR
jgi:uncharacterized membrane protein